jgi:hypothetical protein
MKKPVSLKFILLVAVPAIAVFVALYVTGFTLLLVKFMKWLFSSPN